MVLAVLERLGVHAVFGIPGGALLPLYDALVASPVRHVLARHEQGAGHMAEGLARSTGRLGVAVVTSGPGLTNAVTPLLSAATSGVPLLLVSGQVPLRAIGTDAFQECPATAVTMPIVKHSWLVEHPDDVPLAMRQAAAIALADRPGPVHVDIPKDVLGGVGTWRWPEDDEVAASVPGLGPTPPLPRPTMPGDAFLEELRRRAGGALVFGGGAGCAGVGTAIPMAIGARVGRPDLDVWAVETGAGFTMNAQELITAVVERIPIKVVVTGPDSDQAWPDHVRWAAALGCVAARVGSLDEVPAALDVDDRPVVVEVRAPSRVA